jgi:hypothetical protein
MVTTTCYHRFINTILVCEKNIKIKFKSYLPGLTTQEQTLIFISKNKRNERLGL